MSKVSKVLNVEMNKTEEAIIFVQSIIDNEYDEGQQPLTPRGKKEKMYLQHLISVSERGMDKDKLLEEISAVHSGNRTEGIKIIDRITNYIGGEV